MGIVWFLKGKRKQHYLPETIYVKFLLPQTYGNAYSSGLLYNGLNKNEIQIVIASKKEFINTCCKEWVEEFVGVEDLVMCAPYLEIRYGDASV